MTPLNHQHLENAVGHLGAALMPPIPLMPPALMGHILEAHGAVRRALIVCDQDIAELKRVRDALETISKSHIGDQPAAVNVDDAAWAWRCHGELRSIAREALKQVIGP